MISPIVRSVKRLGSTFAIYIKDDDVYIYIYICADSRGMIQAVKCVAAVVMLI